MMYQNNPQEEASKQMIQYKIVRRSNTCIYNFFLGKIGKCLLIFAENLK